MIAAELPKIDGPTIVCVQAGNVNTGAFDPMAEIVPAAKEQGAWVHVDGAFGFWAAASSSLRHLAEGQDLADSWATDCHKYLNVPYDAGVALVRDASSLEDVMSVHASYLLDWSIHVDQMQYTPEMSRRARGVPTYAVLRHLGRSGLERLVDHTVEMAQLFAGLLSEEGFDILNDVVLNQVLVSFGSPEETHRVIEAVKREGVMYAGPTEWQGKTAMRISVSGYSTTEDDVRKSVDAMVRASRG
jgi:glutamate/tyrosine decarboxylase-like PLP-dependent enzyme